MTRLQNYTDAALAATVAEVSRLPLTPFEQSVLDDIRAEQDRRAYFRSRFDDQHETPDDAPQSNGTAQATASGDDAMKRSEE